jgi:LmbE family N-acetylglucosaminyl deacetylase
MRQVLIAIFAHPDDEAFGPGGTIALMGQRGWETHIICVTDGSAGDDNKGCDDLADSRCGELRASAEILGVQTVHILDFADGCLCNSTYHEVADAIKACVLNILDPEATEPVSLRFMTFEPRGVTGHIDHMTVSMITSYLFSKTPEWTGYLKAEVSHQGVMYYCQCETQIATEELDYFVYFPPGYPMVEIDEHYDVSGVFDAKLAAMQAHDSQKHDYEMIMRMGEARLKDEYFLLLTE